MQTLRIVLGDQLSSQSPLVTQANPHTDAFWMAEVREESTKVWSHKARTALFLSAMRHFAEARRCEGFTVHYAKLDDPTTLPSLAAQLSHDLARLKPAQVVLMAPGEFALHQTLTQTLKDSGIAYRMIDDPHFMATEADFEAHAKGRKQLRMEFFYREMRKRYCVLMNDGEPEGGAWNFDAENRGSFGKSDPPSCPPPIRFLPDSITQKVIDTVNRELADHPGSLESFDWPVTEAEALQALDDFVIHRLPLFGQFQDAMWDGGLVNDPYLFHSRLSAAMNLKLLDPRVVIHQAEAAYRAGSVSLAAAEGFIRQILGWREYVRGIYWLHMPDYLELNALNAQQPLPSFYWTGETDMRCLNQALGQTLSYGYAHHIQRLMVTGLFALLLGIHPKALHQWYLAVYVDAIEWVELPNTLGMSQYGDGGIMASKPYVATGKYIQKMSNYCDRCPYNPAEKIGPTACPFTTLYWDFLLCHEQMLSGNPRMGLQLRNLARLSEDEKQAITTQAQSLRQRLMHEAEN